MAKLEQVVEELVTANRILAQEGIVDSFGHASVRHPERPDRYLLSRARAPDCIEADDIVEYTLEGEAIDARGRKPYTERFIHGAIYEARPDIHGIVHNHSPSTIPFGTTGVKLRPMQHMCACIGHKVPTWDSQTGFGDTKLLVETMQMGRDLAKFLGKDRTALMRGHGCVVAGRWLREAVYTSIYLELAAKLQMQAAGLGKPKFLTKGEVDLLLKFLSPWGVNRAWENWCRRAGRPFTAD